MEKVKVFIVEDEVIIAESIVRMVEKVGYTCVGRAIRAKKALDKMLELKPDIALLDINLKGEESGIWLAGELQKSLGIPFIYMTSFGDKKTIEEAASTTPYGYLLKPVEQQNVHAAIETALARYAHEQQEDSTEIAKQTNDGSESETVAEDKQPLLIKDALFIKDEYQYLKVNIKDIDFIKADGNYIELHSNGRKKVFRETLKNIEAKLPPQEFFQIHRSYLVNVGKITSIGSTIIRVQDEEIPISRQRKETLLEILNTVD